MVSLPYQRHKALSELTTFGIGGPASYFFEARSIQEMKDALKFCHAESLPFHILGKGSNSLFDDQGFSGMVILNKIDFCERSESGKIYVGAGYSFSLLGVQTARQGWSGLEFASGIPASVGGAIWMNAGANGSETSQALRLVEFLNEKGELSTFEREALDFAYRSSPFQKLKGAIVAATFQLNPSQEARQKQISIIDYRKKTQPLAEMSAGCIFRNPNCGHAGALIEQSDLKGFKIGGAKVSEVHANFIINAGGATAQDVLSLIALVQAKVKERTQIVLEPEVRFIPYEPPGINS